MKRLLLVALTLVLIVFTFSLAQTRVYRQIKSVSVHQTGKVIESEDKGNLFEITLQINEDTDSVLKTNIKRLDKEDSINIYKRYSIKKDKNTLGSAMGDGGKTIVAVADDGDEILEIGEEFLFSSKGSTFTQMTTGVYQRIK